MRTAARALGPYAAIIAATLILTSCDTAPSQASANAVVERPAARVAATVPVQPLENAATPANVAQAAPPPIAREAEDAQKPRRAMTDPIEPAEVAEDSAAPVRPFPDEVTRFMVQRDGCDHFLGEEPYDEERRAYLDTSINELCTGTDRRLKRLRMRFADNPDVIAALKNYEDVESPPGH